MKVLNGKRVNSKMEKTSLTIDAKDSQNKKGKLEAKKWKSEKASNLSYVDGKSSKHVGGANHDITYDNNVNNSMKTAAITKKRRIANSEEGPQKLKSSKKSSLSSKLEGVDIKLDKTTKRGGSRKKISNSTTDQSGQSTPPDQPELTDPPDNPNDENIVVEIVKVADSRESNVKKFPLMCQNCGRKNLKRHKCVSVETPASLSNHQTTTMRTVKKTMTMTTVKSNTSNRPRTPKSTDPQSLREQLSDDEDTMDAFDVDMMRGEKEKEKRAVESTSNIRKVRFKGGRAIENKQQQQHPRHLQKSLPRKHLLPLRKIYTVKYA